LSEINVITECVSRSHFRLNGWSTIHKIMRTCQEAVEKNQITLFNFGKNKFSSLSFACYCEVQTILSQQT